jgi:hypothetical protein
MLLINILIQSQSIYEKMILVPCVSNSSIFSSANKSHLGPKKYSSMRILVLPSVISTLLIALTAKAGSMLF